MDEPLVKLKPGSAEAAGNAGDWAQISTDEELGLAYLGIELPTGDQMNLLGTGAAGFQPFAIVSGAYQKFSPHANVSYQWNGTSILAGNPATGESGNFPDQVGYAAGADVSVTGRMTVGFDLLEGGHGMTTPIGFVLRFRLVLDNAGPAAVLFCVAFGESFS